MTKYIPFSRIQEIKERLISGYDPWPGRGPIKIELSDEQAAAYKARIQPVPVGSKVRGVFKATLGKTVMAAGQYKRTTKEAGSYPILPNFLHPTPRWSGYIITLPASLQQSFPELLDIIAGSDPIYLESSLVSSMLPTKAELDSVIDLLSSPDRSNLQLGCSNALLYNHGDYPEIIQWITSMAPFFWQQLESAESKKLEGALGDWSVSDNPSATRFRFLNMIDSLKYQPIIESYKERLTQRIAEFQKEMNKQ